LENNTVEKMEYRTRIEEMKNLISKNKFQEAMNVADTINWRKVHNINDLISGSESYEVAGKIEEARELLLVAHERSPIGRMIIYKLCTISIKLKELDEAQEYYNEFVQIAPHDSLKYILKYHINVAKGADNATLIKILEQLKENDFIEEWAYELAYLYHKTNQAEKCIGLCDEIILWFGDGPVVERALELKMLYQPLDKTQEDKYRNLQKKDGLTEITPQPVVDSSSLVPNIKPIELPEGPERFDTINLQAEIKKNIVEIMKATDTGEVSENIGAIKNLVEEIPYLKVQDDQEEPEDEDFSINDTFQQYLEEGFDGQISLKLADNSTETEEQVEGQMTIEDVLAEWEKTKRAAEAAMEDAKSKELESARAKALREANNVLNRLEGAMSKLDAGMTSTDLLKEEYLGEEAVARSVNVSTNLAEKVTDIHLAEPESEDNTQEDEDYTASYTETKTGFTIPMLSPDGMQKGLVDIPVVSASEAALAGAAVGATTAIMHSAGENEKTPSWTPPTLGTKETEETEDVDFKEASQMIADVNSLLQKEIDRLSDNVTDEIKEEKLITVEPQPQLEDVTGLNPLYLDNEEEIDSYVSDEYKESEEEYIPEEMEPEVDYTEELEESYNKPEAEEMIQDEMPQPTFSIDDIELPPIEIPQDILEEMNGTGNLIDIPVEPAPVLEEEPSASVQRVVFEELTKQEPPVNVEIPQTVLDISDDDLEVFSYFLPITGMKNSILRILNGAASYIAQPKDNGGGIVIVGESGSGKTQMATSIIKVLQKRAGGPNGGIGKIAGEKLNEKDIQKLYAKIQGGCLIIETAGGISKETAVTLSLLMEQDNSGTIIILEDNKKGIDKALLRDASFAKRFKDKVVIPVFSIDELVSFARTYALEAGCVIDDMGILALYNRINLIGRYDHVTTIKEVAEIMDEAIEKSTKGGFFNKPKYDKYGNVILKEKDFDK